MMLPVRKPNTFSASLGLNQAAADLFLRRRRGHLDPFHYSMPLFSGDAVDGANIWAAFLRENPSYIIASREAELIAEVAPVIGRFVRPVNEFIDFGPGSIEAFTVKSRPLIDNLTPKTYRPIDLCDRFLSDIKAVLGTSDPDLLIRPERCDFLSDNVIPADHRAMVYWGGSSFSNIPTQKDESIPIDGIEERLRRLLNILPRGGHCLITLDTTNDPEVLMSAYDHPLNAQLTLNLLPQMQRDCAGLDVDPSAWTYLPVWRADKYVVEHQIVATRPQVVHLPKGRVYVGAGESFVTDHSYKIPAAIIEKIAYSVGWKRSVVFGKKGDIQLLLLSA